MEYIGEVISGEECLDRMAARKKDQHYYYFTISSTEVIDASRKGNIARFFNHSCEPTMEAERWTIEGKTRVGFFVKQGKKVSKGEELTFNYNYQRIGGKLQKCLCGSRRCKGYLDPSRAPKEGVFENHSKYYRYLVDGYNLKYNNEIDVDDKIINSIQPESSIFLSRNVRKIKTVRRQMLYDMARERVDEILRSQEANEEPTPIHPHKKRINIK
eukprot:TRINITY_DN4893_c0_g1_i1.p1 TRINITY_DN4893_c0_g1~~TRINITY_DN4893_c0_g1_i1.p1  ORF type:complete len:214 (-),score=50.20 TRINITY_DN4893_c0_g1_i1:48-689(-)